MSYSIIYADPPWSFGNRQFQSGGRKPLDLVEAQYKTMPIEDIKALPIKNIKNKNSVLFIWTTDAHLENAIQVINAWGFKYKTIGFVWLKKYKSGSICYNNSPYTMKSTEICLLATSGHVMKMRKSYNVKAFVEDVREKHSKKPDEVRRRIVEMFGDELPKIELFARSRADGWDAFGNEIEGGVVLPLSNTACSGLVGSAPTSR